MGRVTTSTVGRKNRAAVALLCGTLAAAGCNALGDLWAGTVKSSSDAGGDCAMPMGMGGAGVGGGPGGSDSTGSADVGSAGVGGSDGADPTPQGCGDPLNGGVIDDLAALDPVQVSTLDLEASYTASLIQKMIEDNVADPSSADDDALQALALQYAPDAAAAAKTWVQGLDPSTISAFIYDIDKVEKCTESVGCAAAETCVFQKSGVAACPLADCGMGKCASCPGAWNLSSILVKGWCAHVCLSGSPPLPVGYATVMHFRGGRTWKFCYEPANG